MRNSSIVSVAWDAWRTTRQGATAVAAQQQRRLTQLVVYARQNSRYFAAHYHKLPNMIDNIQLLPQTNKPTLMANFDEWVTDTAVTLANISDFTANLNNLGQNYLDKYLVWTTSGSSGTPATIINDQRWLAITSGLSMARVIPSWLSGSVISRLIHNKARSAAIFATNGHFMGVTLAERQRRSNARRRKNMRVFSVLTPLPQLVAELNAFQPAILSGYASVQYLLAQEQLAGRLQIQPALISSSGETLSAKSREIIKAAWGVKIWDAYSTSETGVMAVECSHGRLHLNADWFIVEPVDADNKPASPGEPSYKILVTNLASYSQPIIRYEMNDSVTFLIDACPCGSPLPTLRVEGRSDQTLHIPDPTGRNVSLLPLSLGSVVEKVEGVYRYQIIHSTPTQLRIRLETESGYDVTAVWPRVEQQLCYWLLENGLPHVILILDDELPQRNTTGSKLQHVISAF